MEKESPTVEIQSLITVEKEQPTVEKEQPTVEIQSLTVEHPPIIPVTELELLPKDYQCENYVKILNIDKYYYVIPPSWMATTSYKNDFFVSKKDNIFYVKAKYKGVIDNKYNFEVDDENIVDALHEKK